MVKYRGLELDGTLACGEWNRSIQPTQGMRSGNFFHAAEYLKTRVPQLFRLEVERIRKGARNRRIGRKGLRYFLMSEFSLESSMVLGIPVGVTGHALYDSWKMKQKETWMPSGRVSSERYVS